MTSNDDDKIVAFPKNGPRSGKALRKAKQDIERQKLVNLFIDEAGKATACLPPPTVPPSPT